LNRRTLVRQTHFVWEEKKKRKRLTKRKGGGYEKKKKIKKKKEDLKMGGDGVRGGRQWGGGGVCGGKDLHPSTPHQGRKRERSVFPKGWGNTLSKKRKAILLQRGREIFRQRPRGRGKEMKLGKRGEGGSLSRKKRAGGRMQREKDF